MNSHFPNIEDSEIIEEITLGEGSPKQEQAPPPPETGESTDAVRQASFQFVAKLADELSSNKFDLPPFPDVAIRVRAALNDQNVTLDKIAQVVRSEPILVTRLLRLVNSAMLKRGPMDVTDIKMAINRLGFDMVRNASVSMAMDSTFAAPEGSVLRSHITNNRKHSVLVASLSYLLARRAPGFKKPDEAMLAGMLHDIGKFYILTRVEDFPALFEDATALFDLMTDWHSGVGRAIVESWGFPEQIVNAVDEHHVLDREHDGQPDTTDIVTVANLIAHLENPEFSDQPEMDKVPACRKLGIDEELGRNLLIESKDEVKSLSQALNR
jgi:putative nucleotidyltransferase with HDIG domain